jgi:hypothetical protein
LNQKKSSWRTCFSWRPKPTFNAIGCEELEFFMVVFFFLFVGRKVVELEFGHAKARDWAKVQLSFFSFFLLSLKCFFKNPICSLDCHRKKRLSSSLAVHSCMAELDLNSATHSCGVELKFSHTLLRGWARARLLFSHLKQQKKDKKNTRGKLAFFTAPSANSHHQELVLMAVTNLGSSQSKRPSSRVHSRAWAPPFLLQKTELQLGFPQEQREEVKKKIWPNLSLATHSCKVEHKLGCSSYK